ncbi:RHS repeat-associated core domain-containing protein [Oligoflexus tunisiensis]|uniref:RHS repeat-associated core domain-containing protein n=1 Tax=Oligoflexus tunisiensis TaxID=708132 RepID=UPI000AF99DC9|nr:RHS repeat-associated core domain-containing protein [Oligoflexus tunisiensis]
MNANFSIYRLALFLFLLVGAGPLSAQDVPATAPLPTRIDVDPASGTASILLPLPGLPGRADWTPQLALSYQQDNRNRNQGVGVGWGLTLSSIQVEREFGTPHPFYSQNVNSQIKDTAYQLSLDGEVLRFVQSPGPEGDVEYTTEAFNSRLRIQRFDRPFDVELRSADGSLEKKRISSGFIVQSADGLRRVYSGDLTVAEGYLVTNIASLPEIQRKFVSRWPLVYEIKPDGDFIQYDYFVDQGRSYLKEVSFASGRSRYVFHWRTLSAGPVSFASGFRQEGRIVYTGLVACLDQQPQFTWLFSFTDADDTDLQPLSCLREETESDSETGFVSRRLASVEDGTLGTVRRLWHQALVWLNSTFSWNAEIETVERFADSKDAALHLRRIHRFGQTVGRLDDERIAREPDITIHYQSWQAPQEGMLSELSTAGMNGFGLNGNGELFDADQDGLLDLVVYDKGRSINRVFRNQGKPGTAHEFVEGTPFTVRRRTASGLQVFTPQLNESSQTSRIMRSDINGDGWEDLIEIASDGTWTVFFNRRPLGADGFESTASRVKLETPGQTLDLKVDRSFFVDGRGHLVDINGDGRPDIIHPMRGTDGKARFQAYINNTRKGAETVTFISRTYKFPFSTTETDLLAQPEYRLLDINQDGLIDLVRIVALATGSKGLCLYENLGQAAMNSAFLFREDKPSAGVTCEDHAFHRFEDLDVNSSALVEAINGMLILDLDGNGAMDFVRLNETNQSIDYWLGYTHQRGFATRQSMPLPGRIKITKNKYNTQTADIDLDGYDEILLWNVDSKTLQTIDLNIANGAQVPALGLLTRLEADNGSIQTLDYDTYAAIREQQKSLPSPRRMQPLPLNLTLVTRHTTSTLNYEDPSQPRSHDMAEYQYGSFQWDPERGQPLGTEFVRVFKPGTLRQGLVVEQAQLETLDFGLGLTTLEQRRYLGRFPKLTEKANLPWDAGREASLLNFLASSSRSALWFEDVYGWEAPDRKTLQMVHEAYSLTGFPATQPGDSRSFNTAHFKPRYFVQHDSTSTVICGTEDPDCQDPKEEKTTWRYDSNFRVHKRLLTQPDIKAPRDLTLPGRTIETEFLYDEASERLGILNNVRHKTVQSLQSHSAKLISRYKADYHPEFGLPRTETSESFIFEDDLNKIPAPLREHISPQMNRTVTTNYEDTHGFAVVTSIHDDIGLIESYSYGPASLFRLKTQNAAGHNTYQCFSEQDCLIPDRQGLQTQLPASPFPVLLQNAQGYWTRIDRDGLGRPLQVRGAVGEAQTFRYIPASFERPFAVETMTHEQGQDVYWQRTAQFFDVTGHLLAEIVDRADEPAWIHAQHGYSRRGQLVWEANPYQSAEKYSELVAHGRNLLTGEYPGSRSMFDALDRLTLKSSPGEAEITTWQYPSWGQVTIVEGGEGARTRTVIARDPAEPEGLIDEEDHLHVYMRNEAGLLQGIKSPEDREPRSFVFDTRGQLVASILPGIRTELLQRDSRGRAIRSCTLGFDQKDLRVIESNFDGMDRLTHIRSGTGQTSRHLTEFYYDTVTDPAGRSLQLDGALLGTRVYDPVQTLDTFDVFERDRKGRVTSHETFYLQADGSIAHRSQESWDYRADDQPIRATLNSTLQLQYGYDASGELSELIADFENGENLSILAEGRWSPLLQLEKAWFGPQRFVGIWQHDDQQLWLNSRLLCRDDPGPDQACRDTALIHHEEYQRYSDGMVKSKGRHAYAYNKRRELTTAWQPALDEQWLLSPAGHFETYQGRTQETLLSSNRSPMLPRVAASKKLELDALGRVIRFASQTARYDEQDRLLETQGDNTTTFYGYHADGRRSYKRIRGVDGVEQTVYFPSDQLILGAQQQVTIQLPGGLVAEIDLSRRTLHYLVLDAVGTPEKRLDAAGQVVETWERSAYGQLLQATPEPGPETALAPLAFAGHRLDQETGWINMGRRMYIPELGRYLTPDPLFLFDPESCVSAQWQECELYTYAANNPAAFDDPSGLSLAGRVVSTVKNAASRVVHSSSRLLRPFRPTLTHRATAGSHQRGLMQDAAKQRASYLSKVSSLMAAAERMKAEGKSPEHIARVTVEGRNAIKLEVRAQGNWFLARAADIRNIVKYGNRAGPSADRLYQKYGSWEEVTRAAMRTNSTINRLTGNE